MHLSFALLQLWWWGWGMSNVYCSDWRCFNTESVDDWKQNKMIAYVLSTNIHNKALSKFGHDEIAQVSSKMALLPCSDSEGFALILLLQSLSCLQSLFFSLFPVQGRLLFFPRLAFRHGHSSCRTNAHSSSKLWKCGCVLNGTTLP